MKNILVTVMLVFLIVGSASASQHDVASNQSIESHCYKTAYSDFMVARKNVYTKLDSHLLGAESYSKCLTKAGIKNYIRKTEDCFSGVASLQDIQDRKLNNVTIKNEYLHTDLSHEKMNRDMLFTEKNHVHEVYSITTTDAFEVYLHDKFEICMK